MSLTVLPTGRSAERAAAPARWQPTRAGIVNVWRYYDETFAFHRGRLLLRGPNGTGKSKALELLLPYLFDANLRASRLSTFGGQERTMHWNLLGGGYEGKTRVGYVWVEFAHGGDPGEPRWCTLGARLQATVNSRAVSATYFITDQRIGVPGGLGLLGDEGRPLTRSALEAAIGPHGRTFDGATGEYRRAVMHTLFPGFDPDKYEALVFALLQLRTPKLSEHLNPDELSSLLSRALPPVDGGAVSEIAEGFEKLDRRKEDLAALERDVAAAERLADRQRRYAQRVLRAAAAALIGATTSMDDLTRRARDSQRQHDEAVAEQQALEADDRRLDGEGLHAAERLDALQQRDAYRQGQQLDLLRQEAERQRRQAAAARRGADTAAAHVAEDHARADAAEQAARLADEAARRAGADAARAAAHAGLDAAHEAAAGSDDLDRARAVVTAAVDARDDQVVEVRAALEAHRVAVADRDRAEQRLRTRTGLLEQAEQAVAERGAERDAAADRLRSDLSTWAAACLQLPLSDRGDDLTAAADDESAVLALVAAAAQLVTADLAAREAGLNRRRADLADERGGLADERQRLQTAREIEPDPPVTRTAERSGRPGGPLWRLVDFADGTAPGRQATVEAALADSGLLDAWVLPDGTLRPGDGHDRPAGGHDRFADADLTAPAPGASLADVLVCDPQSPVPAERVRRLLAAVAYGPTAPAHPAAVGADGTWRLSTLTGSWAKPEAEFIGASARARARARRVAELTRRIDDLGAQLGEVDTALTDCARERNELADDQRRRPSHGPLQQAAAQLERAEAARASRADAVAEATAERDHAEQQARSALRRLTAVAARQGLPTDGPALDAVADALRGVRRTAATWLDARRRAADARRRVGEAGATLRRSQRAAADTAEAAVDAEREAEKVAVRLATIEAEVGDAFKEILDEVRRLRERLTAIDVQRRDLGKQLRALAGRIGRLRERAQVDEDERATAVAARDAAADHLRRLDALGLAADAGVDLGELEKVRSTLDAARGVAERLATTPHEPRNVKEAEARLAETVHEVRQSLAGRADIALEPDDSGVTVLTAGVDGLRLGAVALHAALRDELGTARTELTDDEQELFDRTLTGSARRQVADRIRHATALVDAMNSQLQRVQTASRMRVRLRWQVDPELPAGTREARDLLLKDPASLSKADRSALHAFVRARIDEVRAAGTAAGWEQQLLEVLDYRSWHEFVVQIDRGGDDWQPVTRRTHGQLSGGERAIALHLPLFAAAAAHYDAATGAPRLILLDEVFVGVDAANRGQLLDLVVRLDLDAFMTSDHEWCTYAELDGVAIHQLITGVDGDDAVTTARFVWDGSRMTASDPDTLLEPVDA